MTSVADDLNAILAGTEAMLRAVCAEALSPAAVMRVELESSRRARAFLGSATVDRRLSVSPGWSDLVESGEALDLLLARLAPVPGAAAPRPLPEAVTARSPSSAARLERAADPLPVRAPARAPAPAAYVAPAPLPTPAAPAPDPLDSWTPAPAPAESWVVGLPVDETEAEEQPAYDSISWDSAPAPAPAPTPALSYLDEDDEATVVGAAVDPASAPVQEPAPADAWSESQWLNYEEQPEYSGGEADDDTPVYSDDALQYVTYTEPDPGKVEIKVPVAVEDLPEWARPIEKDEDTDASATKRPLKPKLAQRFARGAGAKVSEEYEETGGPSTLTEPDEEWSSFQGGQAAQASESTTADDSDRYSSLRGERMHMDDLPVAKTTPSRSEGRSGAAAIQLAADGSSRVLGADDEDEPADIELGDTRDYGDDEALEDDHTGILGVGVLEYDDDEIEELDEVDPIEGPINTLDNLPGAPELTPAEVSALLGKAEDAGRRNMAEGALLYGDVLDAEPTRVDALISRGRLYLDLGDFPAAVSDFLKAEGLQPREPDVQVALGDLFYGRKDYGKAVSYFNRALAIDGDHAVALARRGMAHYYRRQFSAAIEDLERARQLDSSLAHVDMYISRAKKKN